MYRTFFSIELLHSYFVDLKGRGLRVVPSKECLRVLGRHRLTFRQVGNRVYILGRTDEQLVPLVEPDPATVFRFYLVAEDPAFFQFTPLPFDAGTVSRLCLSNLSGNAANGRLYLSKATAEFDKADDYAFGDRAAKGGDLFECIGSIAADPGNSVTDAGHWAARGPVRTPGAGDLLPFGNSDVVLKLAAPVAGDITVQVFGLNRVNNQLDALVLSDDQTFATATPTITVPLSRLPAGRYRATAAGAEGVFYHDPDLQLRSALGVIEIFNHQAAGDAFSLLGAGGKVKGSIFTVLFLNPLVVWKYIARTDKVIKIRDRSAKYEFDDSVALQFRSKVPMPVTEKAYDEIAMDFKLSETSTDTCDKIANPSLANLKRVSVGPDTLPCAEIYLNY